MTDETYQGWTNRETWCVALWLNNEQALQEGARAACNCDGEMEHEAAKSLEDFVNDLIGDGWVGDALALLAFAEEHATCDEDQ